MKLHHLCLVTSICCLIGPSSNLNADIVIFLCRVPRRHIVDTDIHFYHVPTHADASRKRLTEDTEDWRPRTGTTQSRSFKILAQITGTENRKLIFPTDKSKFIVTCIKNTMQWFCLYACEIIKVKSVSCFSPMKLK